MSTPHRRQFLESLLGLAQATGSVVLATAFLPAARAHEETPQEEPTDRDLQARADRLTRPEGSPLPAEDDQEFPVSFLNGGIRRGGFRNGGFRNGGFRKGGFVNGGFRNAGFRNGGFRNGGFRNF